jgi:uncharacterized membrane protein
MSTLVVVGYDDIYLAEEVRLKLRKLQSEDLLELEDAVVAIRDETGKVKLHHAVNLTAAHVASSAFCGPISGLILMNPLLGLAADAVSGSLAEAGINDPFMKELAASMVPGSSTLFVLVKNATRDRVLEELKGTGGKILKTSLPPERQASLQAVLSASA